MYKFKDFNFCNFNPLCEKPILEEYPKLAEVIAVEWYEEKCLDKMCRYVIMVYDPRSPLIQGEKDLNVRKGVATDLIGFEEAEEVLEAIYNCSYAFISDLIMRYLMRFAKSKEWAAICAFESTYWESIKELLDPIEGKDSKQKLESVQKKAAIKEQIDLDIKRLDTYTRAFFGQDDDLLNKVKKRTTPEMIASK